MQVCFLFNNSRVALNGESAFKKKKKTTTTTTKENMKDEVVKYVKI